MTLWIAMAFMGGVFVSLSRQINGRLSLSNSPLIASFWNHIVGFIVLTILGLLLGGLLPPGAADAPWYAFIGGPIGVIFIASGSWLIPRIGAVNTALLVISGQMVSGVILDLFSDQPPKLWASALGVLLILGGMVLTQRRK
ncbi:DMT family transporter [Agrobacterium sp. BA1120]|uniref:DMT family transporter n=1 Tax=Agrobacterium sp. BA1120 TaxID=3228927 RepID=UPI00336ADF9D